MARSWKAVELDIARLLGGERVPVTGRQRGSAPDVLHESWAIEVKAWKNLPARVLDAVRQAEASAHWSLRKEAKRKLPIAIIHHDRQHHQNDLVVLRLSDFLDWFGPASQQTVTPGVAANGDEDPQLHRTLAKRRQGSAR